MNALLAAAISLAATTSYAEAFTPHRLKTQVGSHSRDQGIKALHELQLKGEEDDWNAYIDFTPAPGRFYRGRVIFYLAGADASEKHQLAINYRGWEHEIQEWRFEIFHFPTRKWHPIGNNKAAKDWEWSVLELPLPVPLDPYLKGKKNRLMIRLASNNDHENALVDYLAVERTPDEPLPEPPPEEPDQDPNARGLEVLGVTIDDIKPLNAIVESVRRLPGRATTRIVFDEFRPATQYEEAARRLHEVSDVMGEILDSFYVRDYTREAFRARVIEYLDLLSDSVDIWEIANEINGEWLGAGAADKMTDAFDLVESRGEKTAITLYYNKDCWEKPEHEMFRWAEANIPSRVKDRVDYVWVSYYEDDCNGLKPDWPAIFQRVGAMFPNSQIGIGEAGTRHQVRKDEYVRRYYGMRIDHPRYVGGVFWWYFLQDMVPHTKPLWQSLVDSSR